MSFISTPLRMALVGTAGLALQAGCGAGGTAPPSQGAAGATAAAGGGGTAGTAGTVGAAGGSGAAGTAGAQGTAGATGGAGSRGAAGGGGQTADAGRDAASDRGATDVAASSERFSFFVTSLKAMQTLSSSQLGFGGDLRFGETGPGAGLRGADKICATIAETSLPGSGQKPWRAFLSAAAGETGGPVNAIDRVGQGPWYDRLGRLVTMTRADLLFDRPRNAAPAIINDLPNEDGVPNHAPDVGAGAVDNHDFLTGTNPQGTLYGPTATCLDWTGGTGNKAVEGKPRVGHTWPRTGGRGGTDGGTGGSMGSGANWMSALDESGCAPGVNLIEMGGPIQSSNTVGSGGGYGGIYCFALVP